jgi:hypothetical protein
METMQALLETMDVSSSINELRDTLCEVFHRESEQMFIVRFRLVDGDKITVDVRKPYRTPEIDRFEIYCTGSGTIVATAGTLGRGRQTRHFAHHRELRKWMHTTVQPDATLQLVCQ